MGLFIITPLSIRRISSDLIIIGNSTRVQYSPHSPVSLYQFRCQIIALLLNQVRAYQFWDR